MAFNAFMHPRNIYKDNPPNFKELAQKYPDFKKFCKADLGEKVTIDFKNPESVRALTHALLKNDFDLDVELPPDSLVPRIPLRLNYILWLQDIIDQFPAGKTEDLEIWGVDIGTGASCIYALLGAKTAGWHFMTTERDANSVEVAKRNVETNGLRHLIEVVKVDEHTALCGVVDSVPERTFDFCMCNPPFYDVSGEMAYCASAGRSGRPEPHSATVAKLNEVCAEGGEIGFVSRIIEDSEKLRTRIKVYTSMIGKKASLGPLKAKLRELQVPEMCVTTFSQGKTQRWALAWTFINGLKLKPIGQATNKKDRPALLYEVPANAIHPYTFEKVVEKVLGILDELRISHDEVESHQKSALSRFVRYSAEAKENTWAHNRRKRRAMQRMSKETPKKVAKTEGNGEASRQSGTNEASRHNKNQTADNKRRDSETDCSNGNSAGKVQSAQDQPPTNGSNDDQEKCMLKFDLTIKLWDTKVVLELKFVDGENPDALHQILQFIKNHCH